MNEKTCLRIQLSATRRGARLARLLAERQLVEWGLPFEDAVQVVAELAANAVLHGRVRGRDFRFGLELYDDGTLRVEVTDARGDQVPHIFDPVDGEAEAGRGLRIVAAYAHRWGVDPAEAGAKTVWAELVPDRVDR
ncbi:ATP-binding protein [Streptomyces sp. V3I7]|uniref:ATP-binding protein n=1 Tax=Streptomyces sp. V3I7 TaxID=3042278 RepID=UPI0027888C3C|nr:ATP-binding protein [Streptomyces sp. V3I7]MDQ0991469.1 anti-sigma regulatory factor (Ser/Thr protein kinase) [Streptomyces sp. V3I7]